MTTPAKVIASASGKVTLIAPYDKSELSTIYKPIDFGQVKNWVLEAETIGAEDSTEVEFVGDRFGGFKSLAVPVNAELS